VRRLTVRDQTRSSRSLWQEQVLLVDDQARSIDRCDAHVPREIGTFDRDG
jgi:hypothetical protein